MLADHSRLIAELISMTARFDTEYGATVRDVATSCAKKLVRLLWV